MPGPNNNAQYPASSRGALLMSDVPKENASAPWSDRITASALALANGLVGPSSAHGLTSELASIEIVASKGHAAPSSSAGPSNWAQVGLARTFISPSSRPNYRSERFRSHGEPTGFFGELNGGAPRFPKDISYEDFMKRENLEQMSNFNNHVISSSAQRGEMYPNMPAQEYTPKGRNLFAYPMVPESSAASNFLNGSSRSAAKHWAYETGPATYLTVTRKPPPDGADVVALLNQPWNETYPEINALDAGIEPSAEQLFDEDFTNYEKPLVDQIKSHLPSPPEHIPVSPVNPLNLLPHFETSKETTAHIRESQPSGVRSGTGPAYLLSAYNDIGYGYLPHQKNDFDWLSQWSDVLNSYTDDVWGDILPAVKEARVVISEAQQAEMPPDAKAVGRLRMIFGHLEARFPGNGGQAAVQPPLSMTLESKLTHGYGELQGAWDRASRNEQQPLTRRPREYYRVSDIPWLTGISDTSFQDSIADDIGRVLTPQLNPAARAEILEKLVEHYSDRHSQCLELRGKHRAFLDKIAYDASVGMQEDLGTAREQSQARRHRGRSSKKHPHRQQSRAKYKGESKENAEENEVAIDPFYCPFPRCHETLYSADEFKIHRRSFHNDSGWTVSPTSAVKHPTSSDQQPYTCVHIGCKSGFSYLRDWAAHIKQSHHDLLDSSLALPAEEQLGSVPLDGRQE